MTDTDRFVDTGKHLASFADEVLVTCARCGTAGVVHATWAPCKWIARFDCRHCQWALSSQAGDWVGPVHARGRQPCGFCGHKWLAPSIAFDKPPEDPPTQLAADCPECAHQTWVKVALVHSFPDDCCCDPHFGLPLRLATATRHGTVWAYNQGHLNELSGYVSARLRTHQSSSHRAMFSRLPKWMKLAKHREEIAKALNKLNAMI